MKGPYQQALLIENFPAPPAGKTGWPWTEQSDPWPALMTDGQKWPKISIVTPSFNQGSFLEETIRSVFLQQYPNLEYIIMDGGSRDRTQAVLEKYGAFTSYWESKPDEGQSHAINKGFARATGDVLAWLNSDDYYTKNAFHHLNLVEPLHWKMGNIIKIKENNELIGLRKRDIKPDRRIGRCLKNKLQKDFAYSQPAAFWSKKLVYKVGPLNHSYHYVMDADFMLRSLALGFKPEMIPAELTYFRLHGHSKTSSHKPLFEKESMRMYLKLAVSDGFHFFPCLRMAVSHYIIFLQYKFPLLKKLFKILHIRL